jgi:hypothetical protein
MMDCLGPDMPFGHGHVADEIAERERTRFVSPLDVLGGDAVGHAPCALPHTVEVIQKLVQFEHVALSYADFHRVLT